ncbi:MAG: DNA-binding protein [Methylococcales bacterium]|nr:DNA-binding protein [Methylococcales bacterium]
MIKKSTYARAYEACEAFFTETGQMPTIDAIKPLIGVNSPSTISSAIKAWKNDLSQTIKKDQGMLPGVPASLTETVNALWQQALAEARQVFNERYDELQAQQAALTAKETALNKEAARIQQLLQLTEQKFQDEIAYLKKESDRLTADSISLTEQAEWYRTLATEAEKDNAVLKETIKQEQDKVQRMEIQYDKEHDWALMRIEEEKDSHRQQTQQEMLRLQAKTTRSKQDLDLLQAKFDRMVMQNDAYRNSISELERSLADENLKMAKLTLSEAKLQKELNAKNERIRSLFKKQAKKIIISK